jgi:hypothetical protein
VKGDLGFGNALFRVFLWTHNEKWIASELKNFALARAHI